MAHFRQQYMVGAHLQSRFSKAGQQLTLMLCWWGSTGLLSLLRARRPAKESSALAGRAWGGRPRCWARCSATSCRAATAGD